MTGLCAPLPTLRLRPRERKRTAWGRCGSLLLHRIGLAPITPCRSPGAQSPQLDQEVGASRSGFPGPEKVDVKRDLLAKISAAVPSDSLIDAVRSPIIARKEAGRTARDPGKSDSESGRRIWVRLPRALAAGFVKQALQVTEGVAGLSAAMRGLIVARNAMMTAVDTCLGSASDNCRRKRRSCRVSCKASGERSFRCPTNLCW
jgi:hypothetical protein